MTALPPDVSWDVQARGAYTRSMRFGEWIHEPVTPLFESWLLSAMEERLHALNRQWVGQLAPRPYHVVVNGWYFYSINFLSGGALLRSLPGIARQLVRDPRRVAAAIPQTVRASIPVYEREWREDILPRYREAVAGADHRVETTPVPALPALIDELAEVAGEYFASIAVVAGSAYKMEMNLAQFMVDICVRDSVAATCRCWPGSSLLATRVGMPSSHSTGGTRHSGRRHRTSRQQVMAAWSRNGAQLRRQQQRWSGHRLGASDSSRTSWPRPSASSRCAKSRFAS